MKNLSTIIMALAVIMCMTQCTKPAMPLYDGSYTGVTKEITFSTGGSSKVEIENVLNELKFKWQTGDTLYVYGSENGTFSDGQYCGKLGIVRGMGTENGFFSGTLENVPETGMLRFYYCPNVLFDKEHKTITVDLSDQDGSLEDVASHLVACADVAVKPDGGDYSATLAVPYAVVKFDLHAFGTTAVTMTGTTNKGLTVSANGLKDVTKGGSTTLSGTAVSSATCYVSIMPENVTTLGFSGNSLVGSKAVTLSENKFETIDDAGGSVPVPAALPYILGDFTVNQSTGKKVKFAKGNLYYDGTEPVAANRWKLESNQWDYRTWAGDKSCIGGTVTTDGTPASNCGLFKWGSATEAIDGTTAPATGAFFAASGFTVDGETWFTLNYDEWNNLLYLDHDPSSPRDNAFSLRRPKVVAGVFGIVILPDDTENPDTVFDGINDASSLDAAGAVFLPAVGHRRYGTDVDNVGSVGHYWSATPYEWGGVSFPDLG